MKFHHKSILETICFFHVFSYPLTTTQLYKWLYHHSQHSITFEDILTGLDELKKQQMISVKNGQYVLAHQTHFIEARQKRYLIAEKKYRKALKIVKLFTYVIPGIQCVCVCNNLAYSNAPEESDIDLFIICEQNRLYQTRCMAVLILMVLRLRPKALKKKDKICLSFFLSQKEMNISHMQKRIPDIYLLYWIATLFPIYNKENTYELFMKENDWIHAFLPHAMEVKPSSLRRIQERKHVFSFVVDVLFPEALCKKIQLQKLPRQLREKANQDTDVIINDSVIKLHARDQRVAYFSKWRQCVKKTEKIYAQNMGE